MWHVYFMCPPKRARQDDLRSLWLRRLRVWKVCLVLLLMISAGLYAKTPTGAITGTVKSEAGAAFPHTKVIAKASDGQVVESVFTDDQGRFQFPPVQPGTYRVEVEFAGQIETSAKTVEVKDGKTVELNFIGRATQAGTASKSGVLGPVSFYNQSGFKQGQLENPSGGGGYSSAASAQAVKMLKQYLAAPESPAVAGGSEANVKPGTVAGPHEEELEQSGSALLAHKNYAQATTVFEKATALYPRSERLQMGLGLSLYGAGKYPAAVSALSAAAHLAPDDSAPVVMLSEALQFAPDVAAASVLKRFSDLHPKSAPGHYAYGLSLWNDFRASHIAITLANAHTEFEKAIALDPDDAASHLQLGVIYDEQKATERAAREYLAAIRLNSQLATAHYRLAQDYQRLGKKDKAASELALYEQLRRRTSP
jgi:tetratricopeptide (TPR) repeat protein